MKFTGKWLMPDSCSLHGTSTTCYFDFRIFSSSRLKFTAYCINLLFSCFLFIESNLQNSDILNLGTGSVSWFESNGPGCKAVFSTNNTLEDPYRPIRPDRVDNCLLDYWIIEVIHSSVQIFLTVSSLIMRV